MLKFATAAAALLLAVAPARAALYNVAFNGPIQATQGLNFKVGQNIGGSFVYDSTANTVNNFSIAGYTAVPPYNSIVTTTPGVNPFSAIFEAQTSPVQQGGTSNQTFSLDLEALNTFPTNSPAGILTTPLLASLLDPSLSSFGFYLANSNGTNIRSVSAALAVSANGTVNGIAAVLPEPASFALLVVPALAFLGMRRRAR